jgi:hypothetical protein
MRRFLGLTALFLTAAPLAADEVTKWNEVTLQAIRATSMPPPRASRAMAMVHAAVYDAVNGIDRAYQPYAVNAVAPAGASRECAAAQAAHDVLTQLFPTQTGVFASELASSLSAVPNGLAKNQGISHGAFVGSGILNWRASDGSTANPSYTPGTLPGQWRPTPPANAPALLPGWGDVAPFGMTSSSQFRAAAPPALNSPEYTAAYNEVKELGSATSVSRTAEQTEIANFWADGAGTETPPGHWNAIARDIADQQGNSLLENARMFGLLNIALADAGISAWDTKYEYNLWRPVTGIREGDSDGNPDTAGDAGWTPLLTTPPFPAYTSGHSTFSAAAAAILAQFFGTDAIAFTTDSDAMPGVTRSFASFSQAAFEAGQSRIYGGIHWQFDNTAGLYAGGQIGDFIFANYMQVPEPSTLGLMLVGGLALAARRR